MTDPNPSHYPHPWSPVAPTRKRRRSRIFLVCVLSVVLLVSCGVLVAIIATFGGNQTPRPNRIQGAVQSGPASTRQPAAQPTSVTTTPTVPTPTVPKPKVYKGSGDKVIKLGELTTLSVLKFECPRCDGNTIVESDGPEGLLVNEIGAYKGKRWLNLDDGSMTTRLEIKATGSWTASVGTLAALVTNAPAGKASGKGDDVLLLGGTADVFKITHRGGSGNFVVYGYNVDTGEGGLLVNEIGGYSGEQSLQAPALMQVTADGSWTITPT